MLLRRLDGGRFALNEQLPQELKTFSHLIWDLVEPSHWSESVQTQTRFQGSIISVGTRVYGHRDRLTFYCPQRRLHCSLLDSGQLDWHHRGPLDPFRVLKLKPNTFDLTHQLFHSAMFAFEVAVPYDGVAILDFTKQRVRSFLHGIKWTPSACIGPKGNQWILADRLGSELILTEFNCVGLEGRKFRACLPEQLACLPGPRFVRKVAADPVFVAVEFCGAAHLADRLYFFVPQFGLSSWRMWLPQFKDLKLAGWTVLTSEQCFVLCFQNGTILTFRNKKL